MSITDAAIQAQIIAEVGDVNGILAAQMPLMWARANRWRGTADLQYLWVKREAVQAVIPALRAGAYRKTVGDLTIDKGKQVGAMDDLAKELTLQIDKLIKIAAASRAAQVSVLAATQMTNPVGYQPTDPFSGALNANNSAYRGDPYRR